MSQNIFWQSSVTDWLQAIGAVAVFYTLFLQYRSNLIQRKQLKISLIPKFKLDLIEKDEFFNPKTLGASEIKVTLQRNVM